jgi:hypothetical protein
MICNQSEWATIKITNEWQNLLNNNETLPKLYELHFFFVSLFNLLAYATQKIIIYIFYDTPKIKRVFLVCYEIMAYFNYNLNIF